ncbi:unnamed protein product [Ostreobium quekettii]|uniref:Protein kinase domain-containing protein n=1 Tax=Ostreobium quekettii TaxID=121088 RepID=A0A8S1J236_9CHLO|nr:unnamed protein product [Ostreobium quekettii]
MCGGRRARRRGPDVKTSAAPPELFQGSEDIAAGAAHHGQWGIVEMQAALHALAQAAQGIGHGAGGAEVPDVLAAPVKELWLWLGSASPHGAAQIPPLNTGLPDLGAGVDLDWDFMLNQEVDYRPLAGVVRGAPGDDVLPAVADEVASRLALSRDMDPASFRTLFAGSTSLLNAMAAALSRLQPADLSQVASAFRGLISNDGWGGPPQALGPSHRQLVLILGAATAVIAACLPVGQSGARSGSEVGEDVERLVAKYDSSRLFDFWTARGARVLRRQAAVGSKAMGFLAALLLEWRAGTLDANLGPLARRCRAMIEDLGPAFVKVMQALSTRGDVFPPEFLQEFVKLQDQVPAFDDSEALSALDRELGRPHGTVFEWLSDGPMASASLGQVYHGLLRKEHGGGEVAVKVQRPDIIEGISLDVFLLRRLATALGMFPMLHDNWSATFDEWASRFFDELDYTKEARSATEFRRQMEKLPGVTVPRVYAELTTRRVMTSEWVAGEKLSSASVVDSRATCRTILNCYLIQLLETGFLHADPHPGNILCTPDGRICILDFGLMTQVSKELGFIPAGVQIEDHADLQEILQRIFGDMVNGGGLRVGKIRSELSRAASDHNLVIPPYFALILRVFCIIEGVSLSMDDRFAIVGECLPYLARRLLVDNDPKVQETLKMLLYGREGKLDVERLRKLVSALATFTTDASRPEDPDLLHPQHMFLSLEERVKGQELRFDSFDDALRPQPGPVLNEAVKEALRAVFSQEGSYAQQLLVDEMVTSVETMSLAALLELFQMVLGSVSTFVTMSPRTGRAAVLAPALAPIMATMHSVPSMISGPVGELTDEDRHILNNARAILGMVAPRVGLGAKPLSVLTAARDVLPLASELLPGLVSTMAMCVQEFARRRALKLAEDLDPKARVSQGGDAFSSV